VRLEELISALEIIEQRYNPAIWNIYIFHCSDGDNWGEDNEKAVALVNQLCTISNLFGYGEITTSSMYGSAISKEYEKRINLDNFIMVMMGDKTDIWPAFKKILDTESGGNS